MRKRIVISLAALTITLTLFVSAVLASEPVRNWLTSIRVVPSASLLAESEEQIATDEDQMILEQARVADIARQAAQVCVTGSNPTEECLRQAIATALSQESFDYSGELIDASGTITLLPSTDSVRIYEVAYEAQFSNKSTSWGGKFTITEEGEIGGISGPFWEEISLEVIDVELGYSIDFIQTLPDEYHLGQLYVRNVDTQQAISENTSTLSSWSKLKYLVVSINDSNGNQFWFQVRGFDFRPEAAGGQVPEEVMLVYEGTPITIKGRDAVWSIGNTELPFELVLQHELYDESFTKLTWVIPYSGEQNFDKPLHNIIVELEGTSNLELLLSLAEAMP